MTDVSVSGYGARREMIARANFTGTCRGAVLQGFGAKNAGMMRDRGVIPLDELWGDGIAQEGYVRPFLTHLDYTPTAFAARLHGMLLLSGARTTLEIAQEEGVPIGLASENGG